jgi:hypothetical protein
VKDSFYKELRQVFDQFFEDYMKILLGYFKEKLGTECIFQISDCNWEFL